MNPEHGDVNGSVDFHLLGQSLCVTFRLNWGNQANKQAKN